MNTEKLFITILTITAISLSTLWWLDTQNPSGQLILTAGGSNQLAQVDDLQISISAIDLRTPDLGWVTVSQPNTTISLRAADAAAFPVLLDETDLQPTIYDMARLQISSVMTEQGGTESRVTLPNQQLVLPVRIDITDGEISSLNLVIETNKLTQDDSGDGYEWLPRIQVESRAGVTAFRRQGGIEVTGGDLTTVTDLYQDEMGVIRYTRSDDPATSTSTDTNEEEG